MSLLARQILHAVIQLQMTSHHLCRIVLVRSQLQVLSTLEGTIQGHEQQEVGVTEGHLGVCLPHIKMSLQMTRQGILEPNIFLEEPKQFTRVLFLPSIFVFEFSFHTHQ